MASIIKVDTIQKPDGSTPTAADLGLNVAGSVVQYVWEDVTTDFVTGSTGFVAIEDTSKSITTTIENPMIVYHLNVGRAIAPTAGDGGAYRVYYSTNGGTNWTAYSNPNSNNIVAFNYTGSSQQQIPVHASVKLDMTGLAVGSIIMFKVYARSWGGSSFKALANDAAGSASSIEILEIAQ